ncbi:hypothetical protein J1792_32580 [Streptomyces triculaminicus]|uniref:Uncharacterized protein n=1 Tax=Streptomyces triculaminicus TaxID=2816232 RepID=A0A939JQC3_9ACTN|nr:hypothetical protein [Streptomyces triculaminicus]MBO0657281.1 hypothetical protein [Streptomyces triculaminicus]
MLAEFGEVLGAVLPRVAHAIGQLDLLLDEVGDDLAFGRHELSGCLHQLPARRTENDGAEADLVQRGRRRGLVDLGERPASLVIGLRTAGDQEQKGPHTRRCAGRRKEGQWPVASAPSSLYEE